MRFYAAFLFLFLATSQVSSQELSSAVYECNFQNNFFTTNNSIRMKDYFDTQQDQRLGKVDLLDNLIPIESTPTLIYQIPLWDQQLYIQIWYSSTVRVDSQMSLTGSNKTFPATYHKGSMQQELFCTTLSK